MLYNKVRMHIITVSVTFLQLKDSILMILKKSLLTELEKKIRKAIFFGRACFGWVGRSTANQHFLKVGLIVDMRKCLLSTHIQTSLAQLKFFI